jgi:hypothetical protein
MTECNESIAALRHHNGGAIRMAALRTRLPLADQKILWKAVSSLERESFVSRMTELSGEPVTQLLKRLPSAVSRSINAAVRIALHKSLDLGLYRMDSNLPNPGTTGFKVLSTVTGGISGFFGLGTLALELPISTALMLRSIAGIARKHGEDIDHPATRLACIEVLALGPSDRGARSGPSAESSYYAIRAFLARTVSQAAEVLAERGVAQTSAPVIVDLVAAIGSRFGMVVSEKVAAGAVPIVGALGAAAVNLAFMDHFQKLAEAHFAVRRLERQYGSHEVMRLYRAYASFSRQRRLSPIRGKIPGILQA